MAGVLELHFKDKDTYRICVAHYIDGKTVRCTKTFIKRGFVRKFLVFKRPETDKELRDRADLEYNKAVLAQSVYLVKPVKLR